MTKQEAIKFLRQIYPYGGGTWLDEQRTEAIGMAISALEAEEKQEDCPKIKGWVARGKNNSLYLYSDRPCKFEKSWRGFGYTYSLNNDWFPEIKWEDEEPTEVELIIKTVTK